jgi:transcriptional regulator with XRE-family HTH domain
MYMDPEEIGRAVMELRNKKKIGLRQLARMAQISPASLISIEKGAASPTLATLNKVLQALGTSFNQFFSAQENDQQIPVFHPASMRNISDAHREYTLLFPKRSDLRFEMVLEDIGPEETKVQWEVHKFDLGGTILSGGEAVLEISGIGKWDLSKGDAYYIPAGLKHRIINSGKKQLKQITVISPPKY